MCTVSLGEIDRFVCKNYPVYNGNAYKPALVRAYKFADKDGSGLISSNEFRTLLRSLDFFSDLWTKFQVIDVDNDNSISLAEFIHQREHLGIQQMTKTESTRLFQTIDVDRSGKLRFYELASHCAQQLAIDEERHEAEEGSLLAARTKREGVSESKGARKKNVSHDGLLITAPRGTEFQDEWLDIVEGLEDLEHQSAEAMHGLRESSEGGKGGRLAREGRRLINRRRCKHAHILYIHIPPHLVRNRVDTRFQDKFRVPKSLQVLHATQAGDGAQLAGFPDLQYHSYKLKMAASPLLETACTSKHWPKAGRRADGSFRGGWQHPDMHPDTKMIKVRESPCSLSRSLSPLHLSLQLGAASSKAPNKQNKQKFSHYPVGRDPFPMPYEPQWDAR